MLRFSAGSRPNRPFEGDIPLATESVHAVVRTSEPPRLHPAARFRELLGVRQTLGDLVRKELKIRYKSSILGMAWSMLNPLLYMAVFSLVFGIILPNPIPHFPVYILSGLLAWNLFSTSLNVGARSVVDNQNLVTKVYFPREILPLSSVGTAIVDGGLQTLVLLLFMLFFRSYHPGINWLLLPPAIAVLLTFTAALGMFISALNVRYRDTQYLLTIVLLIWFWVTPIVYPSAKLVNRHVFGLPVEKVFMLNPIADVVFAFQRVFYGVVQPPGQPQPILLPVSVGELAALLAAALVGSLVLLYVAWRTYFLMSGDFAEEL